MNMVNIAEVQEIRPAFVRMTDEGGVSMRLQPATPETDVDAATNHAALAMEAARRIRRARRKSQKEKMGHVVCHHLLCLLNADPAPTAREVRLETGDIKRQPASARAMDDRQFNLGF